MGMGGAGWGILLQIPIENLPETIITSSLPPPTRPSVASLTLFGFFFDSLGDGSTDSYFQHPPI